MALVRCGHGRIRVRCKDPGCVRDREADQARSVILAPVKVTAVAVAVERHGESGATVRVTGPSFNPLDFQRAMEAEEQADRANARPVKRRKRETTEVTLSLPLADGRKRVTVRRGNAILAEWDEASEDIDRARILEIAARAAVRMEQASKAAIRKAEADKRAAERAAVLDAIRQESMDAALSGCNPTGCGQYTLRARSWYRHADRR